MSIKSTVHAPHILLPNKDVDMNKYAVIACDQYTSQKYYWDELCEYVKDSPSTFHMIFPEAYLGYVNEDEYIKTINSNIEKYLNDNVLQDIGECFVLVERTTSYGTRRLGLIFSVDLEDYSYEKGSKTPIRASEATIVERIPPRLKIRKDAKIELPHILLLFDDKKRSIVEKLYQNRANLPKIYDFELNMNGGHIRGYKVSNIDEVIQQFNSLYKENNNGLLFLVGDGNHSLATAKAHWELIKKGLSMEERQHHPARYALVEANNLYDEGIIFEPIHRVLFNVDCSFVDELKASCNGHEIEHNIYLPNNSVETISLFRNAPLAYLNVQTFLDDYLSKHKEVTIDFVHDEDQLKLVVNSNKNCVGITMPALTKDDLFNYIAEDRVLPRKSFSLGHANEKRYYLEAKRIINN